MEQVVLKGITYTKASEVAKQFGYTSDYIGQLCRKGKVRCESVGRSWFVDVSSVVDYRAARYSADSEESEESDGYQVKINRIAENRPAEKTQKKPLNNKLNFKHDDKGYPIDVRKGKLFESKTHEPQAGNFLNRISWNTVSYEPDSGDLIPSLLKKEESKQDKSKPEVKLNVLPAESKKVVVKKQTESYELSATELPKVSLNGTLRIADYSHDADEELDENSFKNKAINQSPNQLKNRKGAITIAKKPPKPRISLSPESSSPKINEIAHYPKQVEVDDLDKKLPNHKGTVPMKKKVWLLAPLMFLVSLILAVGSAWLVLSFQSEVFATSSQINESHSFDFGRPLEIFR